MVIKVWSWWSALLMYLFTGLGVDVNSRRSMALLLSLPPPSCGIVVEELGIWSNVKDITIFQQEC